MAKGHGAVNAFDKRTWDDGEEAYFDYVDGMIDQSKNDIFSNGKAWHAAYLIFKFLQRATKHIRIFSGTLVRTAPQGVAIYSEPEIIDAACAFLTREGSKLQIVLEKDIDAPGNDPNEHPLVRAITRSNDDGLLRGTLEIRRLPDDAVGSLRDRGALHHLMLVDQCGWRIEIDPNPDNVKAVVNAGDSRKTPALCRAFDATMWAPSQQLIRVPG